MRTNDWVGKRQAARQPVNMRGEMRFLDGNPPKECLITDISATGCAIELFEEFDVPEDFDLFIPSRGETKICKIRRAAGVKLGVAFLKSRLDDPLVMQTLLERVMRLERGYAELKGAPVAAIEATVERRESSEPRRAEDREMAIAGPSIDQRIQALASGLSELRGSVDKLLSEPRPEAAPDLSPRVEEQSRDIGALKDEMAALAKAMRGAAGVGLAAASEPSGPVVDYGADISTLRQELNRLSVAMREIADAPALKARPTAVAAAPSEAGTREIAKIRADISELRAALDAAREEAAAKAADKPAPAPTEAGTREIAKIQADMAELRAALEASRGEAAARATEKPAAPAAPAGTPFDRMELIKTRTEMARMRDDLEGALASIPQERFLEFAEAIGALRAEVGALREQVRFLGGVAASTKAEPTSDVDFADGFAALHAEVEELRARMTGMEKSGPLLAASPIAAPAAPADIAEFQGTVKALILLVSQALNRLPDAA